VVHQALINDIWFALIYHLPHTTMIALIATCGAKCAIDYLRVWLDLHCDKTTHFVYLVLFLTVGLWLLCLSLPHSWCKFNHVYACTVWRW